MANITSSMLKSSFGDNTRVDVRLKVGTIDTAKIQALVVPPAGSVESHGAFLQNLLGFKNANNSWVSNLEEALNADIALARISSNPLAVSVVKGPDVIYEFNDTIEEPQNIEMELQRIRMPKPGEGDQYMDLVNWALKPTRNAGVYKLPQQSNCSILSPASAGTSDFGQGYHECLACAEGCTSENMQPAMVSGWSLSPPLSVWNAYDMIYMVEFLSVRQVAPFSLNGIWHKMRIEIARNSGKPWFIEMGPQLRGGVGPGDALQGKHVAMISDTELPSPDGTLVKGRWLALPSKRRPGDIGECKRTCVGCEDFPQLASSGLSTGTLCTIDVGMDNNMGFVYRIHKSKDDQKVEYDGSNYMGTEWQINIHDTTTGGFYVLGRVILEGNAAHNGIRNFAATHQHLGCSPCDAYYQATRSTGPFVLQPKGMHAHVGMDYELQKSVGYNCAMHRVVGLGGYSVLYESGPTVWPEYALQGRKRRVYQCDKKVRGGSWGMPR